jgi:fucose permease
MATATKHRGLFTLLFTGFTIYGANLTTFGSVVPRVIIDYGWSYTATGLVLAATAAGLFLSSFVSGLFIEGTRPKAIYIASYCLIAVAMGLFARWPSLPVNVLLAFVVGVGQGIIEVVTNYEVVRLEQPGEGRLMNLLHAGFCIGAIAAPLAIGAFLREGNSWHLAFPVSGGLFLLFALVAAMMKFPAPERGTHHGSRGGLALLRQPALILLCVAMMLYVGSELGASNWVAEYFARVLGAPVRDTSFALSALWIGLFLGRLLLSALNRRGRQELVMMVMALLGAGALLGFLAVRGVIPAMFVVFALGLCYAGIYPLIVTIAGQAFRSSAAVGMLTTAAGIGSLAFPYLLAGISQVTGLRAGFLLLAVLPLGIAAISLVLTRLLPRHLALDATLEKQAAERNDSP